MMYTLLFFFDVPPKYFSQNYRLVLKYPLLLLFIMTKSGLDNVTRMSGGMVEPFKSKPGMSAYTSMFSGLLTIMTEVRWFNTESWR